MSDAERLKVTLNSPRNYMFVEEVNRLGENSLTSRMIREIYEDNNPQITEMFLCETQNVILKPNVLYRFDLHEDCAECKTLTKVY